MEPVAYGRLDATGTDTLGLVAAFHRLRDKAEHGAGLGRSEACRLARLLTLFDSGDDVPPPRRADGGRRAILRSGGASLRANVLEIGLWEMRVRLEFLLPPGEPVELSVASRRAGRSWQFSGRVKGMQKGGLVVVALDRVVGRDEVRWPCP